MAKFVYLYTGGSAGATPQEQQEAMQAWGAWFGELGASLADGGNQFGASVTIGSDGAVSTSGGATATGYTIVTADSLSDATAKAKSCPIFASGGGVQIHEAIEM